MHCKLLSALTVSLLASTVLFAADKKAKILLIGKDLDHPRNTHTYMSDCTLLAKCLPRPAASKRWSPTAGRKIRKSSRT